MSKISIITVCYNSQSFISAAIESVISQDYYDLEYIIIDGGSTDDTISIIQSYGNKIDHFVSEPDMGIYDAMNKGLTLATGKFIGFLNSDDFYPTTSIISDVVDSFQKNLDVDMVFGNVAFVHPKNTRRLIRLYSSFHFKTWKMRFGFMPAHPATFVRRATYEKVGFYTLGYKIAADFEWFVRAFLVYNSTFLKLNKIFVYMREGGVSTSGFKSNWIATKEMNFALSSNKIFSSLLLVIVRLPYKFIHKSFFKFFN